MKKKLIRAALSNKDTGQERLETSTCSVVQRARQRPGEPGSVTSPTLAPQRRKVLLSGAVVPPTENSWLEDAASALDQALWSLIHEVSDAEAAFWALRNDNLHYRFVLRSQLLALLLDGTAVEDFLERAQQPTDTERITGEFILCWVPIRGGPAILWRADYWQLIDERIGRRRTSQHGEEKEMAVLEHFRETVARDTRIRSVDGTRWLRPLPCPPSVVRALSQGQEALIQQIRRVGRYGRMSLHRAELLRLPRTCFSARFHILDAIGCGALVIDASNATGRDPYLCLPGVYTTSSLNSEQLNG
ncbi:hypothetical protein CCYA_CCYA01G0196 [Cyanidiococcus yangmingshanensis]|nr:hypothetical protein CCYA_CCYA01G0196 [Cyanidiococcus yangmingshanensis]